MNWLTDLIFKTKFHDVKLSPIITNAYHALALDEKRWPFRPTLWDLTDTRKKQIEAGEGHASKYVYEQVWFPGAHSDVGGGSDATGLSDCALEWMMEKAELHGLRFDTNQSRSLRPDPQDKIRDSQSWYYRLLTRYFIFLPRTVTKRLPAALRKLLFTEADMALIDFVDSKGNFDRPFGKVYPGNLSDYARQRIGDGSHAPANVEREVEPA